jgi:predicted HNH restriction endonuclease
MDSKLAYEEYLKSPRWKELKNQALLKSGNKCQVCNSSFKLNVHHREYPKLWGEEPQSFLTVLCNKCHKLFHKKTSVKKPKGKRRNRLEKRLKKRIEERKKELNLLIESQLLDMRK